MNQISDADLANWLRDEDSKCYEDRLFRLKFLAERTPTEGYWSFDGLAGKYLFEEARYCFVYGQFLATILLGIAYLETALAASFYASGRNDLQRAPFSELLNEALSDGLISVGEYQEMNRVRNERNAYGHYRRPSHEGRIESRAFKGEAFEGDELPYDIIERDATAVMRLLLRIVGKSIL